MAYRIEIKPRAERDLEAIFNFIQAEQSQTAQEWFTGLRAAIRSLANFPERGNHCPRNQDVPPASIWLIISSIPDHLPHRAKPSHNRSHPSWCSQRPRHELGWMLAASLAGTRPAYSSRYVLFFNPEFFETSSHLIRSATLQRMQHNGHPICTDIETLCLTEPGDDCFRELDLILGSLFRKHTFVRKQGKHTTVPRKMIHAAAKPPNVLVLTSHLNAAIHFFLAKRK